MSMTSGVQTGTEKGVAESTSGENLRIVEQFVADVWNSRDIELARQLLSPEYRVRFYGLPEKGYDDYFEYFPHQLETWPDLKVTIHHMFADGEWVAVRYTWTATHAREAFGIPPTGKVVPGGGIATYRVTGGKIVEAWVCEDMLSTLGAMGAGPGGA